MVLLMKWRCSNCGRQFSPYFWQTATSQEEKTFPVCPFCGSNNTHRIYENRSGVEHIQEFH